MDRRLPPRPWGYGFAICGLALATFLRYVLHPVLGSTSPYSTYLMAVLLTAWGCTLGPTIVSLVVGASLAVFLFVSPEEAYQMPTRLDVARLTVYLFLGTVGIVVTESERRVRLRLEQEIRERKRVGQKLRESEQKYRTAVEMNPQIHWTANADGTIVDISERWMKTTGLSEQEALGEGWTTVQHADDLPELVVAWTHSVETGIPYEMEHRVHHVGGEYRWMRSRAFPRRDASGQILGWHGTTEDIHERKLAELALDQSHRQFRDLADAIPQIAFIADGRGMLVYVNRRWTEYTGLRMCGGHLVTELWSVVHPDDLASLRESWGHCEKTGQAYEQQCRLRRAEDADFRWFLCRAVPVRDESGRVVRWFGTSTDIEDQKRSEQAIRDSERIYRAIGESMLYGVWVCDAEGRNIYSSDSFLRLVGMTQEQCSEFGWGQALHPDEAEHTIAAWKECVRTQGTWDTEHSFKGVDGQYHPILGRGVPVRDESGRVTRWAGINLDIRRLKDAEHELREADRRKDEFLAMLAHELRNPLAPIRYAVSLMGMSEDDRDSLRWARDVIDRQVRHLSTLVDDLLDVSRITQGKITLSKAPVAIDTFIQSAVESSRPLIESRHQSLDITIPGEPILVDGDSTRLSQVVMNLLNNAAKYTPEGGHLSLVVVPENDQVAIHVKDDGEGIPSEMLGKIFDLFTQVSRSIDRSQGGLGIGLTLVRRLLEMHSGTIEARSEGLGRGSEFIVRLPLISKAGSHEDIQDAGEHAPRRIRRPRRVLVVDDSLDAVDTLTRLLTRLGHEIASAHDGPSALETARAFRPEVVLLDIGLPGMDGYEVARALRDEPALDGISLVAMTGYGTSSDRSRGHDVGFDAHLVKPVELEALAAILDRSQLASS